MFIERQLKDPEGRCKIIRSPLLDEWRICLEIEVGRCRRIQETQKFWWWRTGGLFGSVCAGWRWWNALKKKSWISVWESTLVLNVYRYWAISNIVSNNTMVNFIDNSKLIWLEKNDGESEIRVLDTVWVISDDLMADSWFVTIPIVVMWLQVMLENKGNKWSKRYKASHLLIRAEVWGNVRFISSDQYEEVMQNIWHVVDLVRVLIWWLHS